MFLDLFYLPPAVSKFLLDFYKNISLENQCTVHVYSLKIFSRKNMFPAARVGGTENILIMRTENFSNFLERRRVIPFFVESPEQIDQRRQQSLVKSNLGFSFST